ncbi:MAG: NUDIX hydrolase [Plectolyngbya sp. WJT66-NPBG17]|jgi:8-oxo-dGTP pyrophosphatase MutT (NUDIX family)|nr:NUDIX hydrolase [Plectolyngbya sp. WJT66-NPBG17]MBW4523786.1 NUDIX hydrolase [Phormidium tanganyikae FI6-MK23]
MSRHSDSIQAIISEVEAHHAIDTTETAHKAVILDHFHHSIDPMDSFCFEPGHATGSAWVMAKDTRQFALIYHKTLDRWLQPGGHAEPEEQDLLTVSLREAQEELGIVLDRTQASLLDLDVHRIPDTRKYPSHLHFDFRYLCLTESQPLQPATDAVRAEWFSLDRLNLLELDPGIERMIRKSIG